MNISNLMDIIRANPSYRNDIPSLLTYVNTKDRQTKDETRYGTSGLVLKLGPTDTALALGGLKAAAATNPLLESMMVTISTIGIDFANDIVQGMIDQLIAAGAFTPELGAKLKAVGIQYYSIADRCGGDATEANVLVAIATLDKEPLLAEALTRYNSVVGAIQSGEATDTASMVAKFSE